MARRFREIEKRMIAMLNRPNTSRIIKKIQQSGEVQHQELASFLGVTSQAITWQVKLLKNHGIIAPTEHLGATYYSLKREAGKVLDDLDKEHPMTHGF